MATRPITSSPAPDEIFFHNSGVSLCLLVNRRARTLRVIDFRSGPSPAKRVFVMSLARREGVERVFTLVERDECSTWSRMGFTREGTIGGFYKRSDAFVLGATVPVGEEAEGDTERSGLRPALSHHDDTETDRAYQAVRKLAKEREEPAPMHVNVQPAREADVHKAVSQAVRAGRALTGFEPFGRDVTRSNYVCTARGGLSLMASVEMQSCFNNALLELLTAPRTDKEVSLASGALRQICDELFERGVVGCFALSPVDELQLGAIYVHAGFRRTGTLAGHLLLGRRRADAFLWTRKLAQPADN
jgi:hypothetical protein